LDLLWPPRDKPFNLIPISKGSKEKDNPPFKCEGHFEIIKILSILYCIVARTKGGKWSSKIQLQDLITHVYTHEHTHTNTHTHTHTHRTGKSK
jgi:hypothetical protein